MTAAVTELLAQLVEVTAPPPDAADPEAVLAAFDAMIATRATLLHALEAATPRAPTAAGLNLAEELARFNDRSRLVDRDDLRIVDRN